jgi:hypothetical protein
MPNAQNTQRGAAKAPPIPSMDVSPPPAATAKEIRQQVRDQVRDIARQAKTAAQDAKKTAQDAQKLSQAPAPSAPGTTTQPPGNPDDFSMPQQAVGVSVAFFLTVAVCVIGFPLARAFARRIDRKTEFKAVAAPDLTPHIRQLQDSVDAMAIELERISEGQRFTAKLLAERSGGPAQ